MGSPTIPTCTGSSVTDVYNVYSTVDTSIDNQTDFEQKLKDDPAFRAALGNVMKGMCGTQKDFNNRVLVPLDEFLAANGNDTHPFFNAVVKDTQKNQDETTIGDLHIWTAVKNSGGNFLDWMRDNPWKSGLGALVAGYSIYRGAGIVTRIPSVESLEAGMARSNASRKYQNLLNEDGGWRIDPRTHQVAYKKLTQEEQSALGGLWNRLNPSNIFSLPVPGQGGTAPAKPPSFWDGVRDWIADKIKTKKQGSAIDGAPPSTGASAAPGAPLPQSVSIRMSPQGTRNGLKVTNVGNVVVGQQVRRMAVWNGRLNPIEDIGVVSNVNTNAGTVNISSGGNKTVTGILGIFDGDTLVTYILP